MFLTRFKGFLISNLIYITMAPGDQGLRGEVRINPQLYMRHRPASARNII